MLEATIKGKTPESVLHIEDILTSTVFGYLQYFPVSPLWKAIFAECKTKDGVSLYETMLPHGINWNQCELQMYFWPQFSKGEPDLVVEISSGDTLVYVIIEVKLWSLKSSHGKDDQLFRYYNLISSKEFKKRMSGKRSYANLGVIYLTPRSSWQEIQESLDLHDKDFPLFNLRWQDLYTVLESGHGIDDSFAMIQKKLTQYIFKVGLTPFDGFTTEIEIDYELDTKYPGYFSSSTTFNGFQHMDIAALSDFRFYERS